jgi:hypothetical protein
VWHTVVRDLALGTTHTIDSHSNTQPAAMSADGRYVALYIEDDHGDPFGLDLRDRATSREIHVPTPDVPVYNAVMTPDATYITFSGLNGAGSGSDLFRWRRGSAAPIVVSAGGAYDPRPVGISGDGQVIAFSSDDPTLVSGDTNGAYDVFRDDLPGATILRASLSATGGQLHDGGATAGQDFPAQANLMSADGSAIVFDTKDRAVPRGHQHQHRRLHPDWALAAIAPPKAQRGARA